MPDKKWRVELYDPETEKLTEVGDGYPDRISAWGAAHGAILPLAQAGRCDQDDESLKPKIYIIRPDGTKFTYGGDDDEECAAHNANVEQAIDNYHRTTPDVIDYRPDDSKNPDESE